MNSKVKLHSKAYWRKMAVFFQKTEIKTKQQTETLNNLKEKFDNKDNCVENTYAGDVTEIYYSQKKAYGQMWGFLFFATGGIYLMLINKGVALYGAGVTVICSYFSYRAYKLATNETPQITISSQGIKIVSKDIYKWTEISKEEVIMDDLGSRETMYYLTFDYHGGNERIKINDLAIDHEELGDLLRTYRIRNDNKNPTNSIY